MKSIDQITFHKVDDNWLISHDNGKYFKTNEMTIKVLKSLMAGGSLQESFELFKDKNPLTDINYDVYEGIYLKITSLLEAGEKPSKYLQFRLKLISEKHINSLVKPFFFLFKKEFFFRCFFLVFVINLIVFVKYFLAAEDSVYLSEKSITAFIIISIISSLLHELGHATAIKIAGRSCREIGVGFYFFMPVFYADLTNLWLCEKKDRIIANCSGVYFELILSFLILVLSLINNSNELMLMSNFLFFKSMLNFYPFARRDGYWILRDLNEKAFRVPNLKYLIKPEIDSIFDILRYGFFLLNTLFIVIIMSTTFVNYFDIVITYPFRLYDMALMFLNGTFNMVLIKKMFFVGLFYVLVIKWFFQLYKEGRKNGKKTESKRVRSTNEAC